MAMREPAIKEALQAESMFMQDDIERRKYEQREKAIRDYEAAMSAMFSEGEMKAKLENAAAMLEDGVSIEKVAQYTRLLKEQIIKLLKN